ncbi:hypothetical protein ILUMI_10205 [Ignelater luminosus]|uniref:Uncharacterized protein n=1 Tax=Ignelater luminosus TaxID=2038154 RepID=A0A8K0CYC6_IGNLU|nr:hypothetical protein ILUMI_10205 [Ignelater luminosus]
MGKDWTNQNVNEDDKEPTPDCSRIIHIERTPKRSKSCLFDSENNETMQGVLFENVRQKPIFNFETNVKKKGKRKIVDSSTTDDDDNSDISEICEDGELDDNGGQ